jgi:hypothetical protein
VLYKIIFSNKLGFILVTSLFSFLASSLLTMRQKSRSVRPWKTFPAKYIICNERNPFHVLLYQSTKKKKNSFVIFPPGYSVVWQRRTIASSGNVAQEKLARNGHVERTDGGRIFASVREHRAGDKRTLEYSLVSIL